MELAEAETAATNYPRIEGLPAKQARVVVSGGIRYDPSIPEHRKMLSTLKLGQLLTVTVTVEVGSVGVRAVTDDEGDTYAELTRALRILALQFEA